MTTFIAYSLISREVKSPRNPEALTIREMPASLAKFRPEGAVMIKYLCTLCGYVYDPAVGDPDAGIAPGTAFEDLPVDSLCPVCKLGKSAFKPLD
jgi:rubredoxin